MEIGQLVKNRIPLNLAVLNLCKYNHIGSYYYNKKYYITYRLIMLLTYVTVNKSLGINLKRVPSDTKRNSEG